MNESESSNLTELIRDAGKGNVGAQEAVMGLVYQELKQTARQIMRLEKNNTLQPTALVHETYLRLIGQEAIGNSPSRGYFFAAASQAMRRILVDSARRRKSLKRGGEFQRQPFDDVLDAYEESNLDLLSLDNALSDLEKLNPRQANVVNLRWFVELTVNQVAQALGISVSTVEQDWRLARAYLYNRLSEDD